MILSYIRPTYLYYVPCDLLNGKWTDSNINAMIDNTIDDWSIKFNNDINGCVTFVNVDKIDIGNKLLIDDDLLIYTDTKDNLLTNLV